jgi:hypothetical protein
MSDTRKPQNEIDLDIAAPYDAVTAVDEFKPGSV